MNTLTQPKHNNNHHFGNVSEFLIKDNI